MIFKFILFLVILYMLVRFVMRFLLPVLKITRMTHQQMNDMRRRMDEMQGGKSPRQQKRVDGDYIDYEEVK